MLLSSSMSLLSPFLPPHVLPVVLRDGPGGRETCPSAGLEKYGCSLPWGRMSSTMILMIVIGWTTKTWVGIAAIYPRQSRYAVASAPAISESPSRAVHAGDVGARARSAHTLRARRRTCHRRPAARPRVPRCTTAVLREGCSSCDMDRVVAGGDGDWEHVFLLGLLSRP